MSATAITNSPLFVTSTSRRQSRLSSLVDAGLEKAILCGLLALIALVSVPYGTVEPWWIATFNCAVFGLGTLWLIQTMVQGRWTISNWSIATPLLLATGFVFLQGQLFSVDANETRVLFFRLLAFATFFILVSRYTSTNSRLELLVHTVAGVALASAVFGILRFSQQENEAGFWLPFLKRGSGFGQFVNKNHFALLMEMATGLLGGFVLGGGVKRSRILFYVTAIAVMWTALVLTSSRGGLFSMLAQVVFLTVTLLWIKFRKARVLKLVAAGVLATCLLLAVGVSSIWVGGDLLVTRLESLSSEVRSEATDPHSGVRRREVWAATWELFKSHPITGSGFAAYPVAITRFHDATGKWTPEAAHNDYLELLASGGLIGTALLIWFAIAFCKSAKHQLQHGDPTRRAVCLGALTGIFGVATHSAVDFGLHVVVNTVVLLVLIVLATQNIRESQTNN
jgi:O-antigen ligase